MNTQLNTQQGFFDDFSSSFPTILLASDSPLVAVLLHRTLLQEGFRVHLAPGYHELEPLWKQHRDSVVLVEVAKPQSVEAAVDLAISLKRLDARQFVGYLADPILHTSGLAGDAIFPRTSRQLPQALRDHFRLEP